MVNSIEMAKTGVELSTISTVTEKADLNPAEVAAAVAVCETQKGEVKRMRKQVFITSIILGFLVATLFVMSLVTVNLSKEVGNNSEGAQTRMLKLTAAQMAAMRARDQTPQTYGKYGVKSLENVESIPFALREQEWWKKTSFGATVQEGHKSYFTIVISAKDVGTKSRQLRDEIFSFKSLGIQTIHRHCPEGLNREECRNWRAHEERSNVEKRKLESNEEDKIVTGPATDETWNQVAPLLNTHNYVEILIVMAAEGADSRLRKLKDSSIRRLSDSVDYRADAMQLTTASKPSAADKDTAATILEGSHTHRLSVAQKVGDVLTTDVTSGTHTADSMAAILTAMDNSEQAELTVIL